MDHSQRSRSIYYIIQAALKGERTTPLHPDYVKEMITRQKIGGQESDAGLGLFLKNQGQDLQFSHNGQDEGFIANLMGYAFRGQGVVIMINDDAGWALMNEITNSVADAYHWPHFEPVIKKIVKEDPSTYPRLLGQYKNEEEEIEISMTGSQLFADLKNSLNRMELLPSGKCVFFVQQEDVTIEFANCEGKLDSLAIIDSKGKKTVFHKK